MISVDKGHVEVDGNLAEVSAEAVLVLREIYKTLMKEYKEIGIANGLLINLVKKAITVEAFADAETEENND